eukprot:TRINITY_DN2972_c1_g1_i1.p1 TRINITY_DN2972_c1_g1~~TRINITY_DN2972_c1_g1_i1.p1  ORF type:complete len:466 (+),score=30.42 TRINITY_DN2972_c1_g1_i1:41-1438(+)
MDTIRNTVGTLGGLIPHREIVDQISSNIKEELIDIKQEVEEQDITDALGTWEYTHMGSPNTYTIKKTGGKLVYENGHIVIPLHGCQDDTFPSLNNDPWMTAPLLGGHLDKAKLSIWFSNDSNKQLRSLLKGDMYETRFIGTKVLSKPIFGTWVYDLNPHSKVHYTISKNTSDSTILFKQGILEIVLYESGDSCFPSAPLDRDVSNPMYGGGSMGQYIWFTLCPNNDKLKSLFMWNNIITKTVGERIESREEDAGLTGTWVYSLELKPHRYSITRTHEGLLYEERQLRIPLRADGEAGSVDLPGNPGPSFPVVGGCNERGQSIWFEYDEAGSLQSLFVEMDTASRTIGRRVLLQGQEPPTDLTGTWEFANEGALYRYTISWTEEGGLLFEQGGFISIELRHRSEPDFPHPPEDTWITPQAASPIYSGQSGSGHTVWFQANHGTVTSLFISTVGGLHTVRTVGKISG